MIKHVHNKWILMTQDGRKKLGVHPSREDAMRQERAINMSKARAAGDHVPAAPKK